MIWNDPRVQERQQVKNQQSNISFFVAYAIIRSSSQEVVTNMTTVFHAWLYERFIEIQSNLRRKKCHRINQGSNFVGSSFSNKDNVRAPIQFWRESQPQHLKDYFFSRADPSMFTSIAPVLLDWLFKWNQLSFCSIETNKSRPAPFHSVSWIKFKFRSQF